MLPEKFTLFVIDCQNDITKEDGAIYVPTSELAVKHICEFINKNKDRIDRAILAKSNHPENHCMFKNHGGGYPKNCVADTYGSKIDERVIDALNKCNIDYFELNHGEVYDFPETSASKYSHSISESFILGTATHAHQVLTDDIVICGMIGDSMVNDTIIDLSNQFKHENIHVFLNGIANVNQDTILNTLEIYHNIDIC